MTHRARYEPEALLAKYREIRRGISEMEFFRSPKHQKTMEIWCAAHFARAYARYIEPCAVRIDDLDIQTDVDFDLEIRGTTFSFQVTEVMEPGRRRGDEYRNGTSGVRHDDIEAGTTYGHLWVRAALEKKSAKNYAGMESLNLLVYLNFAGLNQQFVILRDICAEVSRKFGSVWLLNGNTLCCIQPNGQIPSWEGWMEIEESLVVADSYQRY